MNAGRELDKMIAEKVLGWYRPDERFEAWQVPDSHHPGEYLFASEDDIAHYSTDAFAAWQLIERIAPIVGDFAYADGWFHLTYSCGGHDNVYNDYCDPYPDDWEDSGSGYWSAHLHLGPIAKNNQTPKHWKHGAMYCAVAPTMPHAVCLAILKAFETPPNPEVAA